MGRKKYCRKTKTKITTKTAISKSELRAARRREEMQINQAISSKREVQNRQNKKEEDDMLACAKINNVGAVGIPVDKQTVINEFKNEKMSIQLIADTHGMDDNEILSILICDAYSEDGLNLLECANQFGITKYRVCKVLEDNNIQRRHRGGSGKNKDASAKEVVENVIEDAPNEIEEETAEVKEDPSFNIKVNCQGGGSFKGRKDELKSSNKTIIFCEQSYSNEKLNKIEFDKYSQDVVVAGLCKNRHDMPVGKYIFDTLTEKEINDPKYIESRALGFVNAYVRPKPTMPAKTLVLYCTGFALALSTIVKICVQNKVNLLTMHWNPTTQSYVPQNTLDIFGKVPTIDEISPLKGLENKYKGGVYLFGCKTKRLVEQGKCTFISLQDDYYPDRNSIVLFPYEFPTDEVWKFYAEVIKMSRNEGFIKRQYIQIGLMDVSLSGYIWGDVVSKSYNWRDEKSTTKRIIG